MPDLDFSILATLRKPNNRGPKIRNLIGQEFNRLTPYGFLGLASHGAAWFCRCKCGTFCIVNVAKLISGHTKSCGCHKIEELIKRRRTHGETKTRLYRLWADMNTRGSNASRSYSKNYVERGITVCKGWQEYEPFRDDVGQPPSETHSIDRVRNNDGYWCGHCEECISLGRAANFRWATPTQQARNKRNNHLATYNNETKCVAEWSEISGLGRSVITDALDRGETLDHLFNNPTRNEQRARFVTANGETHRIAEWARIRNMHHETIRRNLDLYDMTPEEALGFVQRTE